MLLQKSILLLNLLFALRAGATSYELRCTEEVNETGCTGRVSVANLEAECAKRSNSLGCPYVNGFYGPAHLELDSTFTTTSGETGYHYRCWQGYRVPGVGPCYPAYSTGYFVIEPVLVSESDKPNHASNNKCNQKAKGSDIDVDNRTVGETIPLVGIPFALSYYSNLQIGNLTAREIVVGLPPGSNSQYPKYKVELYEGSFSGLLTSQTFIRPTTDQFRYTWDGKDAAGNFVRGNAKFSARLYNVDASGTDHYISIDYFYPGTLNSATYKLGGWLPSNFSYYDSISSTEYFADGRTRQVNWLTNPSNSEKYVIAEDGSEVRYYFDNGDLHTIRTTLTGAILYNFSYNTDGSIASITDSFSQATTFNYSGGLLTSITAPNTLLTMVTIDPTTNRLASVTSPNAKTYSMTYDVSTGNMLTFQKPRGDLTTFTYDSKGQLIRDGHTGGFFWDLIDQTTSPGQLITQLKSPSGVTQTVVKEKGVRTTFEPDGTRNSAEFNNYATTITQGGVKTIKTYNASVLGSQVKHLWSLQGHPSGAMPTVSYGESVDYAQDSNGTLHLSVWTQTATLNSKTTSSTYTAANRTWLVSSPEGRTSSVKLDSYERPIEVQQGSLNKTELSYSQDKLTKIKRGARETTFAYNGTTKFLDSITNPALQTISFGYNLDGQVSAITLPDLRVIGYEHDANGNVTSITPPGRPVHSFTFNSSELLGQYTPPILNGVATPPTTYVYNTDKKLSLVTRSDASTVGYGYDPTSGKLNQVTTAGGIGYFAYDMTTGLVNEIRTPNDIQVVRVYSGILPAQENIKKYSTNNITSSYSRTFDSEGRVATETVSAGSISQTTNFAYDNDGNLTTAGAESIAYDANGLVSGTTQGNFSDLYYYNSFGEVTGYTAYYSGSLKYFFRLKRDDLGRIIQKDEMLNGIATSYCYTYDTSGRLVTVTKNGLPFSSITWDDNGNRTSYTQNGVTTTATYDDQDRLIANTTYNFSYNLNGEMISRTNALTSQVTSYTYDNFGHVLSVTWPGTGTTSFAYDGLGRQVVSNGIKTRGYIYDFNGRLIGGINSATGAFSKRYVYGSRSHVPDYYVDETGTSYRLVYDNLGSLRLIVRVSNGLTVGIMEHDEFGVKIKDTTGSVVPFGFAGGLFEPYSRLVHFGAREYSPFDGRWLTKDPIGFDGGDTNLYSYVASDPVNWVDPSGLKLSYADTNSRNTLQPLIEQLMQSPAGAALVDQLESSAATYTLQVVSGGPLSPGSTFRPIVPGANGSVSVDQCPNVNFDSNKGTQLATPLRILAHELGHLTGTRDNGPGRMNNVNGYENPIMTPIDGLIRISY